MALITSTILKRFLEQDKRKFESLFPDLVKKLIINSYNSVSSIRIPGHDDVWAPGFDGIVESQEQTTYVAAGKSVWELGTNADSLSKINKDFNKRTDDPLGIDKPSATFYLVIPRLWAYDNQGMPISKWESEHKDSWRDVHVYDASVLCDWIESEPVVCAWLFEQYGEGKHLNFSSVSDGWESFSNHTNPPLTFSMFLDGRQGEISEFMDKLDQKTCRVKSDTRIDAYGFCLSALMQSPETTNKVIVVKSESAYLELAKYHKGKVFLLSFPFSGQVSDDNSTIVCYSKESTSSNDMMKLPVLWKSQFTKALREMGLSDVQANECYSFTHGNLLSLIRRIPGNVADLRPKWANAPDVEFLYPIIFLRQFIATSEIDRRVLERISGIGYADLERKYESFLRMEDAPIKRIDDRFFLVNYEEAWMTLRIDASDIMSSRMHEIVVELLGECREVDRYSSRLQATIIQRLIFNYIYFAETGSNTEMINSWINTILGYATHPGCKEVVFQSLSDLAEAAPVIVMGFIEAELENGVVFQAFHSMDSWDSDYHNVLWALDKLVFYDDTAIRACKVMYRLCKVQREYNTTNSPKESLLNALCLWSNYTAITIKEKTRFVLWFIEEDSSFGIPFAIELITKNSIFRGVRIGEKERRHGNTTHAELYESYKDITSVIINNAIKENHADWVENINMIRRLPSFENATVDELIDINKELHDPLVRFRGKMLDYSNGIQALPWDKDFEKECNILFDKDVAPSLLEIEEQTKDNGFMKNLGRVLVSDKSLLQAATGLVVGIAAAGVIPSFTQMGSAGVAMTTTGSTLVVGKLAEAYKEYASHKKEIERKDLFFYYKAGKTLSK